MSMKYKARENLPAKVNKKTRNDAMNWICLQFNEQYSGLQAVTWKNIGINIGHFSKKYRANIGKSSKI